MTNLTNVSNKVADLLLEIGAVKLQPDNPFTWTSGWKSPIYCDNRKTLSYPQIRTYISEQFVNLIKSTFSQVQVIAGVATAGIAQGVLVANLMELPFVYVRGEAKGHGLGNQIEGVLNKGQRVVVVEDLISTGKSSLAVTEAVKTAGGEILGLVSIFNYGFLHAEKAFNEAKCPFNSLSNYETLLRVASDKGLIKEKDLEILSLWRKSPETWGK